jgi:archaellum biogenesis ATPase FlaH
MPLSARDEQVEQNRTLFISVHQHELERGAFDRLSNHSRVYKKYQNSIGSQCSRELDTNKYDLGVHITDEQMSKIKLRGYKFHKD